jgi:hypothetical protein
MDTRMYVVVDDNIGTRSPNNGFLEAISCAEDDVVEVALAIVRLKHYGQVRVYPVSQAATGWYVITEDGEAVSAEDGAAVFADDREIEDYLTVVRRADTGPG